MHSQQTRLIVNGDDFGISEEVNRGIIAAFQKGVLTSCSLMVTGEAFEDAVQLARQNSRLAVGIHLVTVCGRSVLPKKEIPDLVDDNQNFSSNANKAGWKYYFSLSARKELRKELAAQFEKFQATGLSMSHIDGHLHMHVHPVIFNAALDLGERYGVKRMRVPVESLQPALAFDRAHRIQKTVYAFLFRGLGSYMKKKLIAKGFSFANHVYGNLQSGKMNEKYFLYVLNHLNAQQNEIYFHPGDFQQPENPEQLQAKIELDALLSETVAEQIRKKNFQLISYRDLDQS